MDEDTPQSSCPTETNNLSPALFTFLATSLAVGSMMKRGNYSIAIRLYSKTGGGGFNVYKQLDNNKVARYFAIDFHPFWNKSVQQSEWRLHYHRGETSSQMKKHRPYEGGW